MQFSFGNLLLLVIFFLALASSNHSVAIAAALVLLMSLFHLDRFLFPWLEAKGIQLGVVILTVAILVPLASGRITGQEVMATLQNVRSLMAVLVGVVVAYLAGKGVGLLASEPQIVTGLIVGTIIGVAFFKGVSVGPLIGSGMLYFLFKLFKL